MSISFPGRAVINPLSPDALGICDRCGFQYNLRDLRYQKVWAGPRLITLRERVCDRCYDVPNEQLRTIRIPPDPVSVSDPRPEDFSLAEYSELFITKYIGWEYMFGQNVSNMSVALADDVIHAEFSDVSNVAAALQRDAYTNAEFSDVSNVAATLQRDANMAPTFSDVSDVAATLQRDANMTPAFSDVSNVAAELEQTTGYSFNMTAGVFSTLQGYSNGDSFSAFGSIDQEPILGQELRFLISGGSDAIAFVGDVTSLVSGLSVWVDSVEYPFDTDWAYSGGSNQTTAGWTDPNGPTFVDTNMYFVEIK